MKLQQINVIGLQSFQGGIGCHDQAVARGAKVIRAIANRQGQFGRQDDFVAASFNGFAQNLFGRTVGIDVGTVEHVQACFQADIDHAAGFAGVNCTPCTEQGTLAAKGTGPKAECRDTQTGIPQLSVFHCFLLHWKWFMGGIWTKDLFSTSSILRRRFVS